MKTQFKTKFVYTTTLSFCLLIIVAGCNLNKNRKFVDVSDIDYTLEVNRFENDLMALPTDTNGLVERLGNLERKYPDFLHLYTDKIMGFGGSQNDPELIKQNITMFVGDTMVQRLYAEVREKYKNFEPQRQELELAIKHFKYHFPNKKVPQIVTFMSYFGWVGITYDTTVVGIGLDMHLGADFPYPADIPGYVKLTLDEKYMAAHTMRVMGTMMFDYKTTENTLLAGMLNNGKQLYFTELMLPETPEYIIADYDEEHQNWSVANEPEIWNFFVERNLLYSTNMTENNKLLIAGPITSGMPEQAPGNMGTWVGWRIVKAYMDKYPDTTFEQLLNMSATDILSRSKYKPR